MAYNYQGFTILRWSADVLVVQNLPSSSLYICEFLEDSLWITAPDWLNLFDRIQHIRISHNLIDWCNYGVLGLISDNTFLITTQAINSEWFLVINRIGSDYRLHIHFNHLNTFIQQMDDSFFAF